MLGGRSDAGSTDDKYRNTHRVERPFSREEEPASGGEPPKNDEPRFGRMPGGKVPSVNMSAGGLVALVAACLLGWCATGFYIVPEGQVGVVTTFGRYTADAAPGFNWRMPWPVQDAELVDVSSVRKTEIGIRGTTSRLKEALMLTDDETSSTAVQRPVPHQARAGQGLSFPRPRSGSIRASGCGKRHARSGGPQDDGLRAF